MANIDIEQVREMLGRLLNVVSGEACVVEHFFYGNDENLGRVKDELIRSYTGINFGNGGRGSLVVVTRVVNDDLSEWMEAFDAIAEVFGVEYDGYIVAPDGGCCDDRGFLPFEDFFKPLSYVKLLLSNGKYAYLLFLGGDDSNGHFFECLSLSDDGDASVEVLDKTPRIFRQPVMGYFDPLSCILVGRSQSRSLPKKFSFRCLEGEPLLPEQVDKLHKRFGIVEGKSDKWALLEKLVETGSKDFACPSTTQYEVTLDSKGKAKCKDLPLPEDVEEVPMPFFHLIFEELDNIFTKSVNGLDLLDKAHERIPLEYDNFEVALFRLNEPVCLTFKNFGDFFAPLSYLKIRLLNDKYAYLLFLGGNSVDSYFFECLSLNDDGSASVEILDEAPRVFRQPIQGDFDPQSCILVGRSQSRCLPMKFSFRKLEFNLDLSLMEASKESYKRYREQVKGFCRGYDSPEQRERDTWLHILEEMVRCGDVSPGCFCTRQFGLTINSEGKVEYRKSKLSKNTKEIPMPFGKFLSLDKLNSIFIEGVNELDLIDRVYGGL